MAIDVTQGTALYVFTHSETVTGWFQQRYASLNVHFLVWDEQNNQLLGLQENTTNYYTFLKDEDATIEMTIKKYLPVDPSLSVSITGFKVTFDSVDSGQPILFEVKITGNPSQDISLTLDDSGKFINAFSTGSNILLQLYLKNVILSEMIVYYYVAEPRTEGW